MLVFSFYDNNINNTYVLTYVNHTVLLVMGCRFITTVHLNVHLNVITSIIIYILKLSSTNEV